MKYNEFIFDYADGLHYIVLQCNQVGLNCGRLYIDSTEYIKTTTIIFKNNDNSKYYIITNNNKY